MFARKISVMYVAEDQNQDQGKDQNKRPCPLKWMDNFAMRNFTNASVFDDTLPVADGILEIGSNVPLEQLGEAMEDWFYRKGYLPRGSKLSLEELTAKR